MNVKNHTFITHSSFCLAVIRHGGTGYVPNISYIKNLNIEILDEEGNIKNDENEDDEDNQDLEEDEYDDDYGDEQEEDLEDIDVRENISTQISTTGMDDIYEPIKAEFELKSYESVQSIGNQIFISAFVNNEFEKKPFESEKREFPAFFNSKYNMTYITNITTPEGYEIESLPENLNLRMDNNMGNFSYVLTPLDDMLSIRSIFKVNETFLPQKVMTC